MSERVIYTFWTGDNPLTENRIVSLLSLEKGAGVPVILVKKQHIQTYILPNEPFHPAYPYLSETQKSDYLRCYFMHFYGGGYSDIKQTKGTWTKSFDTLYKSDNWICGYKWKDRIGSGAFICKPNTPLTQEWYTEVHRVLDTHLEALRAHPATGLQDCYEKQTGYPLQWEELMDNIFGPITKKYKDKVLDTLPLLVFKNYR